MRLNLTALAKLYVFSSFVSCALYKTLILDAQNASLENRDLSIEKIRQLFQTRSYNTKFITTLNEDLLKKITNGHQYILRSLSEEDVKNMQVDACGYAIHNAAFMNLIVLGAASKQCVENLITRIPAGDRLLTAILSLGPSYLRLFNKSVIEYINTNPDGICKKIDARSLLDLPINIKKLFTPECFAQIANIAEIPFSPSGFPVNTSNVHKGNLHGNTFAEVGSNQPGRFTENLTTETNFFIPNIDIGRFSSHNSIVTREENTLNIQNVQSSAISFQEVSIRKSEVVPVNVPIVKCTKTSKNGKIEKIFEKEETENTEESSIAFKEGDFVMQPKGRFGTGPFVIVSISEGKKLVISDCSNGRYKRDAKPNSVRKCEDHEIVPCPVFKVEDTVVVKPDSGKLVGPLIITAIDSIEHTYLLSETGSGNDSEFFEVPWSLLRHYEENISNEYVKEKLVGEDIIVHPKIKAGDTISFCKKNGSKKEVKVKVLTTGTLRSTGIIRITSTEGAFEPHFCSIYKY